MISSTGDNLNILICTEYAPHNDWMSFVAWYSIHKAMPSSQVAISCSRVKGNTHSLFNWTTRCGVKCFQHKNSGFENCISTAIKNQVISLPILAIPPSYLAVKELSQLCANQLNEINAGRNPNGDILFLKNEQTNDATIISELDNTFVNHDALQKFSSKDWTKNKTSPPFNIFWKFFHENMTVQEAKILHIWKRAKYIYENLRFVEL
jgi:hypothetical protein